MRNIDSRNKPVTHDRFKPWPFPRDMLEALVCVKFVGAVPASLQQ
jgi:hypothetical protein